MSAFIFPDNGSREVVACLYVYSVLCLDSEHFECIFECKDKKERFSHEDIRTLAEKIKSCCSGMIKGQESITVSFHPPFSSLILRSEEASWKIGHCEEVSPDEKVTFLQTWDVSGNLSLRGF